MTLALLPGMPGKSDMYKAHAKPFRSKTCLSRTQMLQTILNSRLYEGPSQDQHGPQEISSVCGDQKGVGI